MKKFLILFLMVFLVSCASSGAKKDKSNSAGVSSKTAASAVEDVFSNDTSGQYVYYHDKRGTNNALCGFLKFNKTDYVARRYDLNTGKEVVFQFNVIKTADGSFDVSVSNVLAGDEMGVAVLLTDISNMASQYQAYLKKGKADNTIRDEWPEFGYTLNHTYKGWIPLFHLYKHEQEKNSRSSFTLLYVGVMKDGKDYVFFQLKKIPQAEKVGDLKLKKEGPKKEFKLGIYEVALDDNWIKAGLDKEFAKSYWVKKRSSGDAQVTIEIISKDWIRESIESLANRLVCYNTWVIPSSVKIVKKKNYVQSTFIVLDPSNMNETYMCDIHKLDKDGNINSFHFSAFKNTYDSNRKYFDSIVNNLVIREK